VLGVRLAVMPRSQLISSARAGRIGWPRSKTVSPPAGDCSQIFACGLSMGGILSLLFASRFPLAGSLLYPLLMLFRRLAITLYQIISMLMPRVAKAIRLA